MPVTDLGKKKISIKVTGITNTVLIKYSAAC